VLTDTVSRAFRREQPRDKVQIYEDFNNWVLLATVRQTLPRGGRVLDVGCASGGLLRHIGSHASYRVGIEPDEAAAAAARDAADRVLTRAVNDPDLVLPAGSFDVAVCGDVLEHMEDPGRALHQIASWTREGGAVVVSVPNIANWQARFRLFRGVWRYEPSGIWDDTHLRFFTLDSLKELVASCGLTFESVTTTQAARHQVRVLGVLPAPATELAEHLLSSLARRRPQLFGLQFVAVARKTSPR
jgi:SAM-dependent methyltransferase